MQRIGFVGLGNIGGPASVNLLKAGFAVTGFDPRPSAPFVEAGGIQSDQIADLGEAEIIVQSLPTVAVLDETIEALLPHLRPGTVVVDLSSYPLDRKRAAAERLAGNGATMLDCEISGLPQQVAARSAVIFKSGDEDSVARAAPVFDAIAERHFYLGPFGAATKMKLVANTMVCVHNLMAAEALSLGVRIGLDPAQMVEVLGQSAAGSATFANKAPLMLSRAFADGKGPFRHMFGYLARASELAREAGAATPLLDTAREIYGHAERAARHDEDIASIVEVIDGLGTQVAA